MELLDKMFIGLGILFIMLGVIFILIPFLVKFIPSIQWEKIPWIILWVYRKNGFAIATSPILIIVGILYLIWIILKIRYGIQV